MKDNIRLIGQWLGWCVVVSSGCVMPGLYEYGYRNAQHECEMAKSCDGKGGRLNWDKTKCMSEVEIPIAVPQKEK